MSKLLVALLFCCLSQSAAAQYTSIAQRSPCDTVMTAPRDWWDEPGAAVKLCRRVLDSALWKGVPKSVRERQKDSLIKTGDYGQLIIFTADWIKHQGLRCSGDDLAVSLYLDDFRPLLVRYLLSRFCDLIFISHWRDQNSSADGKGLRVKFRQRIFCENRNGKIFLVLRRGRKGGELVSWPAGGYNGGASLAWKLFAVWRLGVPEFFDNRPTAKEECDRLVNLMIATSNLSAHWYGRDDWWFFLEKNQ